MTLIAAKIFVTVLILTLIGGLFTIERYPKINDFLLKCAWVEVFILAAGAITLFWTLR